MKNPVFELKAAIHTRLETTTPVKYPVYSEAGRDSKIPYIQIGQPRWNPWNTKGSNNFIVTIQFDFWDRNKTSETVDNMQQKFEDSLTFTDSVTPSMLTLTNFNVIRQDCILGFILDERDTTGFIKHGVLEVEFWLQKK